MRPSSVVLRLLATAVAAAVVVLVPAPGGARAHDELVATIPSRGATLDVAPATVRLEFTRDPQSLGTQVVVSGPDGTVASTGAAEVSAAGVTQRLVTDIPAGRYTVAWRVTSADGHPLSGSFGFTVAAGAEPAATDPMAAATRSAEGGFPVVWAVVGAVVAVAGGLIVRQLRRPA